MKAYVEVRNGYVDSWSTMPLENYQEIEADESIIGLLECVRIENGVAVVDEEKRKQLVEELSAPTEIERLKQENEELRQRVDMSDEALLELADMILATTMKGGV